MAASLTGKVLLAHPGLHDPNFRRTLIYLIHHDSEEGAFGLVLNRAMGSTVAGVLPEAELGLLEDTPVFFGGPVGRDQLTFALFSNSESPVGLQCRLNLDIEEAKECALLQKGQVVGMVGYSGWSAGQLEAEIDTKSWLTVLPQARFFNFDARLDPALIWKHAMDDLGSVYSLMAREPDDTRWN